MSIARSKFNWPRQLLIFIPRRDSTRICHFKELRVETIAYYRRPGIGYNCVSVWPQTQRADSWSLEQGRLLMYEERHVIVFYLRNNINKCLHMYHLLLGERVTCTQFCSMLQPIFLHCYSIVYPCLQRVYIYNWCKVNFVFNIPHGKKSRQVMSDDRSNHAFGKSLVIHRPEKVSFRNVYGSVERNTV